jgi:branched-chain amino acid transport system ATP-binding protein
MCLPKWTPDVGTMLDVEDVDAGYGDTTVLRKVGLRVDAGEVVALLGPNGAGKTTLLRVASGLNRANAGRVRIGGDNVTQERPYQRARRGMCHIPEGRGIYPSLTVRENIRLFARGGAEEGALDRATAVFPALGSRLSTTSGQLSGGQQQMLSLSRACIQRPSIVLVDEASMGLAPVVVDEIFEFLQTLAATGVALLIVEQYVARALALADRVYVLNKGEIVAEGSPAEIGDDAHKLYLGTAVAG